MYCFSCLGAYRARLHCGAVEAQSGSSLSVQSVAEWSRHFVSSNDFDSVHNSDDDGSGRGPVCEDGPDDDVHHYLFSIVYVHGFHVNAGNHCSRRGWRQIMGTRETGYWR